MIDAITQFKSFYDSNFDYTNVSGLTRNPYLYTFEEYNIDNDIKNDSSFILIKDSTYKPESVTNTYYKEKYVLTLYLYNSSEDTRNDIVAELDRIVRVNNSSSSRTYILDIESQSSGGFFDAMLLVSMTWQLRT